MPIPNGIVQSLIRNDTQYASAPGPNYALILFDGLRAVQALFTVWDPAATFEQRAATHPLPKAEALAATFILDVPVLVSAWPRKLVDPGWAAPVNASPDDLVIVEGNHRLLAVALRASWGMPLPRCIGVFAAQG
jgi:hypothetical protein